MWEWASRENHVFLEQGEDACFSFPLFFFPFFFFASKVLVVLMHCASKVFAQTDI